MEVVKFLLGSKKIAYDAELAKMLGSVPAAVFMSQGLFWQESAIYRDHIAVIEGTEYINKTAAEWYDETGVTPEQQKSVRDKLKALGLICEVKAGIPARLYIRFDLAALVAAIELYQKTGKSLVLDGRNKDRYNTETGIGILPIQAGVNYSHNKESLRESLKREYTTNNSARAEKNDFYSQKEIEAAKAELDDLINQKKETAPPVAAAPPAEKTEFEKWLDVLDSDDRIKEGFCITQKVPEHLFADYVKRFKALANTQVEKYVRKHDLTGHFLNWSGSEYRKEKKEQQAQASQAVGASMVNKAGVVTPLPY
jgi:hypothetical protein